MLGRGGMGEVYLALDETLDRRVAIKVLAGSLQHDEKMKARFHSEARTIASLNHPNIVTLYEVGETDSGDVGFAPFCPYLVMEYIEGKSLERILDERRIPLDEALGIAIRIAEGLRAAHERRLVHRDIKPSNLMVTSDGHVKILDFGLSKLVKERSATLGVSGLTTEGMIAGTLEYLSPEQALGKPLDARTDLFSLGIVFYELLTGEHAFHGASATEKMANIVTQPSRHWPAEPEIPVTLKRIVERLLQKEPENRYRSAGELVAVLEEARREARQPSQPAAALSSARTAESPAAVALPVSTPGVWSRKRVRWGAAIAALVVALASGAIFLSSRRGYRLPVGLKPVQVTSSAGLDINPAFSPDGKSLAYASDRTGSFEIYVRPLLAGAREIQITNDGARNLQPVWSPGGESLAYVSKTKGGIWVVPSLGGVPRRLTDFGSAPAYSPDGSWIAFQADPVNDVSAGAFPALPPSTIWLVPATGGKPTRITEPGVPGGGHGSPSWSPDGVRIVFVTYIRPGSEMWTVDRDGKDLRVVTRSLPYIFDPVFAPDGRSLYFSSAGRVASSLGISLWNIPVSRKTGVATGEAIELLNFGTSAVRQISVSRDGRKLAMSAISTASNLWSLPMTDGVPGEPSALTRGTGRNSRPVFSPDGKKIAYSYWRTGGNNDLWLIDADGRNAAQLTADPANDDYPTWFPDGERLAFSSTRSGRLTLWSLSIATSREEPMADLDSTVDTIRLSPNGKWIAYNSKKAGGTINVWLVSVDGSSPRQLTFDKELAGYPCWSPDSAFVAIEVKRGANYHVALVPREGGEPSLITSAPGLDWPNSFSPDGRAILFAGFRDGFWNLWTVDRTTKAETRLTQYASPGIYVRYPAYSPKGDQIVYELAETNGNIWMVEATD